jgi:hypothetical protein
MGLWVHTETLFFTHVLQLEISRINNFTTPWKTKQGRNWLGFLFVINLELNMTSFDSLPGYSYGYFV